MILELRQHLWFDTPYGQARAMFLIDYGQEDDLQWVCVQQDGDWRGTIRCWHNSQVRVLNNESMLRPKIGDNK